MGMIFNTAHTLNIIKKLNAHYAPGNRYNSAKSNDPARLVGAGTSHQKSKGVGIDQDKADQTNGNTWKKYLDNVIDVYDDSNHPGQKLGVSIVNAILGYLRDSNCIGIQFFANYSNTTSVTTFQEPAPGGKYYGSILVTSLSIEEALAEQQLARGRPIAKRGARVGVQAPAAGKKSRK